MCMLVLPYDLILNAPVECKLRWADYKFRMMLSSTHNDDDDDDDAASRS